jgi:hypothetical protein
MYPPSSVCHSSDLLKCVSYCRCFKERHCPCRNVAVVPLSFGSDLRASVFRQLFQEALGRWNFIVCGWRTRIPVDPGWRCSAAESKERALEAGSTAIQAKNSSHRPILNRQESQRQMGFWGV